MMSVGETKLSFSVVRSICLLRLPLHSIGEHGNSTAMYVYVPKFALYSCTRVICLLLGFFPEKMFEIDTN